MENYLVYIVYGNTLRSAGCKTVRITIRITDNKSSGKGNIDVENVTTVYYY